VTTSSADPTKRKSKRVKRDLVGQAVTGMRKMILSRAPNAQIGSLPEVALQLGVGIVTVQQAARVLEHQGFLVVRRGIGGGYYGTRPDALALERALESFFEVHTASGFEALKIMTLLDCEIMPAAAACSDPASLASLREIEQRIDGCRTGADRISFEIDLHNLLFKMVQQPLMELFARVNMQYYGNRPIPEIFDGEDGVHAWQRWRHDLVSAILAQDAELAHFQARRHRRELMKRIGEEPIGW
jgi:DNA-binding FadR family transcriptional regulator